MTTLLIKDLAHTADLNATAMATVRGGSHQLPLPGWFPSYGLSPASFTLDASQMLGQSQNVVNNNGNNVAFASGISSSVTPHQSGANTINFGS